MTGLLILPQSLQRKVMYWDLKYYFQLYKTIKSQKMLDKTQKSYSIGFIEFYGTEEATKTC